MGGPMDYTPGFFHFQLNQYDTTRTQRVRTTLAKQLALYVTMYSPLQMAGDFPENFDKYPDAFQFIRNVPVDWEQTHILEAEPGDYITIARQQKGTTNWFIGGITDENPRRTTLDFAFLPNDKTYQATIYQDGKNAHWNANPTAYQIQTQTVNSNTKLAMQLAAGGGFAIELIEK